MSISLKTLLPESVNYIPPHVDVTKATRGGSNPKTKEAARQLFYDFYAIDFLHRQFGPSHMTTGAKVKAAMSDPNFHSGFASGANWDEVDYPLSQVILNKKFVDVIEHVHEQVTREISRKLLAYLRLGLVQELRHMMSQCSGWRNFRQELVSIYNKKHTISKEDFKATVQSNMPAMMNDIPSVMRLLKFSKIYSKMGMVGGKDPFDAVRTKVQVPGKPLHTVDNEPEIAPDLPEDPAISTPDAIDVATPPEKPDDTDYNTEIPDYPDYDYPSGEFDPEDPYDKKKKKHLKEDYAGGRISPSTIKKIYKSFNESGMTWQDVDNAYNKIPWNGSYGGPRWGTGSNAYLKLLPKHKDMDTEQMAALVDHIFDLEHNTGGLLNKGGMNMDDVDLDRRAKATHVARYLPFVSPVIKRLILMFMKHLPGNPEEQKNIDVVLDSPLKPFTPEEDKILKDNKFYDKGDARRANIRFFSKKKDSSGNPKEVHGRYYEAKSHADGRYTLADDLKADIQIFNNFGDLAKYINSFKNDIKDLSDVSNGGYVAHKPKAKTEAEVYIDSHSKLKLPKDYEEALYSIKMGWRPSSKYYKAYFTGSNRFYMYAFTDGTYLCAHTNSPEFKVFTDWGIAFEYCKVQTQNATDKNLEAAKAYIGVDSNTVVAPQISGTQKIYSLSNLEQQSLAQLVAEKFPETSDSKYAVSVGQDGLVKVWFYEKGKQVNVFSVGKQDGGFGHPYKVLHYLDGYLNGPPEVWPFSSWKNAFAFIKNNINQLVFKFPIGKQINKASWPLPTLSKQKELPPYSTSNASYSSHIGIMEPPKVSIRLTKKDEDAIGALGFEAKMIVGNDVWYVHKITKDGVRFYANNMAKLVFTNNSSGIPATLKFDIPKMLAWLSANYNPTTTTSPLQSGGSPIVTKQNATGASLSATGGFKAGSGMFEKRIANAGFIWDAIKNYYVDGTNILVVHKNRQSDIQVNGENIHFQNLPDLANFLQDEYPDKKKSKPTPVTSNPKTKVNEIKTLLLNAGVLDANGNITDTTIQDPFSPSGNLTLSKIVGIKLLRSYISEKGGQPAGIAECKWAIENFPLFIDYISENGIPDMSNGYGFILQWAKENPNLTSYAPQSVGDGAGISPFSDENYDDSPFKDKIAEIELNKQDSELLERIGFHLNEHQGFYIKTISKSDTPSLQESTFEDDEEEPKDEIDVWPPDMQPDETEGNYEIIVIYNNGTATWDETDVPDLLSATGPGKTNKSGPIKQILDFVWNRWNSEKSKTQHWMPPATKTLEKLGFNYSGKIIGDVWKYTKLDGSENVIFSHYVKIYPNDKLEYSQYETNPDKYKDHMPHEITTWTDNVTNGLESLKSIKDDGKIEFSNANYNTVEQDKVQKLILLNSHDAAQLAKMGYKLDSDSFGYPVYVNGTGHFSVDNSDSSHYADESKEINMNFLSIKDGLEYLKKQYDDSLTHLFGKSDATSTEPLDDIYVPSDFDYIKYAKENGFSGKHVIRLTSQDSDLLKSKGYVWDMTNVGHYKNIHDEYFVFFADGTGEWHSPKAFKNPAQKFKSVKSGLEWASKNVTNPETPDLQEEILNYKSIMGRVLE